MRRAPPDEAVGASHEFWIYDFNTQLFDPVDRVKLAELPESISSFNFLLPIWKKPIFGNNWVEVTRRAADQIREAAIRQGMRRLQDDGLEKVRLGRTSITEVARVVGTRA